MAKMQWRRPGSDPHETAELWVQTSDDAPWIRYGQHPLAVADPPSFSKGYGTFVRLLALGYESLPLAKPIEPPQAS
jgi:hypothetical protein